MRDEADNGLLCETNEQTNGSVECLYSSRNVLTLSSAFHSTALICLLIVAAARDCFP